MHRRDVGHGELPVHRVCGMASASHALVFAIRDHRIRDGSDRFCDHFHPGCRDRDGGISHSDDRASAEAGSQKDRRKECEKFHDEDVAIEDATLA